MTWTWRLEAADGRPSPAEAAPVPAHPTQSDAETWLGESWRELADEGVAQASLLRDGEAGLRPDGR